MPTITHPAFGPDDLAFWQDAPLKGTLVYRTGHHRADGKYAHRKTPEPVDALLGLWLAKAPYAGIDCWTFALHDEPFWQDLQA